MVVCVFWANEWRRESVIGVALLEHRLESSRLFAVASQRAGLLEITSLTHFVEGLLPEHYLFEVPQAALLVVLFLEMNRVTPNS